MNFRRRRQTCFVFGVTVMWGFLVHILLLNPVQRAMPVEYIRSVESSEMSRDTATEQTNNDQTTQDLNNWTQLNLRQDEQKIGLEARHLDMPAKQTMNSPTTRKEIFEKRNNLVVEGCRHYTTDKECIMHAYGRTLVDEAHKTLYCEIFKVGSSNWQRTFIGLVADVTPDFRKRIDGYYKRLSKYSPDDRDAILDEYKTHFMFVRHPFYRLVSCFADKVDHDPDDDFVDRHLTKIEAETGKRPESLTFANFVDYIIRDSNTTYYDKIDKFDQHVMPMYRGCCPCEVKYDFIGHLETQQEDSDFILNAMGVNVSFPKSDPIATFSSAKDKVSRYFSQLTPQQIMKLYNLYEWDFKLFGYKFPDYLKSPEIEIPN